MRFSYTRLPNIRSVLYHQMSADTHLAWRLATCRPWCGPLTKQMLSSTTAPTNTAVHSIMSVTSSPSPLRDADRALSPGPVRGLAPCRENHASVRVCHVSSVRVCHVLVRVCHVSPVDHVLSACTYSTLLCPPSMLAYKYAHAFTLLRIPSVSVSVSALCASCFLFSFPSHYSSTLPLWSKLNTRYTEIDHLSLLDLCSTLSRA